MRYFDLHCDTIAECAGQNQPLRQNTLQLSLERGKAFSPWFQCFAVWIPDALRGAAALAYFEQIRERFLEEVDKNRSALTMCVHQEDFTKIEKYGGCGAILTVEGGAVLAGKLENISYLAECGVRVLTLTWNGSNEIGDGAMVERPRGLTEFGKKAILELEKNDIVIDVSHSGDPLFYNVAEYSSRPFIATHSNARAVCGHPRNITDEQFQIIKNRGGLVGLNFCTKFLRSSGTACGEDVLRHAEHFLSLGGEKTLAIGSDFDGADMPGDLPGIQAMEALAERFLRHGYAENLVRDIFYGNAYRFFNLFDRSVGIY